MVASVHFWEAIKCSGHLRLSLWQIKLILKHPSQEKFSNLSWEREGHSCLVMLLGYSFIWSTTRLFEHVVSAVIDSSTQQLLPSRLSLILHISHSPAFFVLQPEVIGEIFQFLSEADASSFWPFATWLIVWTMGMLRISDLHSETLIFFQGINCYMF